MASFRWLLVLFMLALGTLPARAAELSYPPGSRIGLAPPAGLVPSKTFFGYEDLSKSVAIMMVALPPQAYADLDASVTADALKRQGVTMESREALPLPSGKAFLVVGRQEVDNIKVRKWILVASDSAACPPACIGKLATLRQVRLALGRNAARVERVFVVDDARAPADGALQGFEGTLLAITPAGARLPPGAGNDREHIYLVDPHGNVMMRWRAGSDPRRMLGDLQRLLKASQIG